MPDLKFRCSDPSYFNIYAPYKLQTPSKLTGSLACFLAKGLISVDYHKDYGIQNLSQIATLF
jgi:hypothetical protein